MDITRLFTIAFIASMLSAPVYAACDVSDHGCIFKEIETHAAQIENTSWRDQTYRELAKSKAAHNDIAGAVVLLDKIENPDTRALTIRGIGMAAAALDLSPEGEAQAFQTLRNKADKIDHPPSYAIALTYIAMAQAFAGDNEGAWKTASEMENDALRHKAYGETAEIQAENGDAQAALKSISFIDSLAFRNKAYALVSKILAEGGDFTGALEAANAIDNAYKKATALQFVVNTQAAAKQAEQKDQ